MAFRIGREAIVSDLVLNLDAKNPLSYNGDGTTWYDLSPNGNHFTLAGSPAPSWDGSAIQFNFSGGNQYAQATNTTIGDFDTNSFTMEYVANIPSESIQIYTTIAKTRAGVTFGSGSSATAGFALGIFNQSVFQDDGALFNNSTDFFNTTQDQPVHSRITYQAYTVYRYGSNNDYVEAKVYKTGSLGRTINYTLGATRFASTGYHLGNGNISNTLYPMYLMAGGGGRNTTGSLYTFRMYNRVLTQAEIQNNYSLYRAYYGF